MRVLVAGGAGFIGSHVCGELLSRGHEVVCVDDLSTGSRANILDLVEREAFRFIETDVAALGVVPVDLILHLASPASPVHYDRLPLETMAANSRGTWRLLEIADVVGARLLFTSTSEVYGDPLVHPQPETYWGNVDPIGPRSQYDESKRFGEALIMAFRRERRVNASIARLFNTYGPRMGIDDGRLIPHLMAAALTGRPLTIHGNGTQTRSFCYVDDLVEGLLALAFDPTADGEVLNIGSTDEIPVLAVAERIRRLAGTGSPIAFDRPRPGDPQRRRPDIGKMMARYGWQPRVELDDGLRTTLVWFAEQLAETAAPVERSALDLDVAEGVR
jgi:nucleoside-diphosphate-sugar epimerase